MSSNAVPSKTLYERLGGEPSVDLAVDIFYRKVLADAMLKPFFAGMDMEAQSKKQKQFLTYTFGGPNHYSGKGLRNAHKGAVANGMRGEHFDRVVMLLAATLQELNVPESLMSEVALVAESTRKDVLGQ